MKNVNTIIHTGCGSHFQDPTILNILNEQMLVEKPTTLHMKALIFRFLEAEVQGHGMTILVFSYEELLVSVPSES
jgi:hypothetical protein